MSKQDIGAMHDRDLQRAIDKHTTRERKYLGNFSAVDDAYSRHMECDNCYVSWTGCWDNFQCPKCGEGELPSCDIKEISPVKTSTTAAKGEHDYREI